MRLSNVPFVAAVLTVLVAAGAGSTTVAQPPVSPHYFPLDHRVPGRASEWDRAIQPNRPEYVQPVRIELPSAGMVIFYDGSPDKSILTQAPSQVGMLVSRTYRFQITGMPEFPGASLYPTIELLDRLHPPAGREHEFPIPIQFTTDEIETALEDRLVTKVIYLEQPQWAVPQEPGQPINIDDLSPTDNLLQAADRRGRAMAIIRLGGRVPDVRGGGNSQFYGEFAPVITQQFGRTFPAVFPASHTRPNMRKPEQTFDPATVSVSE